MFGGIDPKKMQAMMRQMGIKQEEVEASKVIIETADKNIVIESPSIQKITMQGQVSWQIAGEFHEADKSLYSEGDVKLIMEKAGVSENEARKALDDNDGDLAVALASFD